MLINLPGRASGVGSWPGDDVLETARTTFGELVEPGIPYLPELPGRGPGADLIGRTATFLVDTPVDLQPSGWRLVARPGRDLERARSMLSQDLDALAEAADGYVGPLKVQVGGPWTLAASLLLPRLERAVVDSGACRDLVGALCEGVARHVADVRRLVPGAEVVVQLDEPSLPAVLLGALPTASGWGRLRAVDRQVVVDGLREVLAAAIGAGAVETVLHCCADQAPLEVLVGAAPNGLGVDVSRLGSRGWETLAPELEGDLRLWAGAVQAMADPTPAAVADAVWVPWRRLGLATDLLDRVVLTPSCGLATGSPAQARSRLASVVRGGRELVRRSEG